MNSSKQHLKMIKRDSSRETIVEESPSISVNNENLKDVAKTEEGNEAQRIKGETANLENATKGTLSEEKGVKGYEDLNQKAEKLKTDQSTVKGTTPSGWGDQAIKKLIETTQTGWILKHK